jgi:hypothetical protein
LEKKEKKRESWNKKMKKYKKEGKNNELLL